MTEQKSLRSRVVRAGGWALTGHFGLLSLRLIGTVILTRIFSPAVFGVFAVVNTISVVVSLLTDIGLHQAVIRSSQGADEAFLNTAWTLQIVRGLGIWIFGGCFGVALFLAGSLGAVPPSSTYASPELPELIPAILANAFVLGFQSMKAVTASRDLNLKRVTSIELIAQSVHLVVTVLLAWATRSVWSYVASGLLASTVTVLLSHLWLKGPRDRFAWDRAALKELGSFGKWIFLSSAVGAAAMNADRLLLAGWLSSTQLGYYSLASNLVATAETLAGKLFGVVALPVLSQVGRERPERFARSYLRLRWVLDTAVVCAAGFLFSAGQGIVILLYDERYLSAGSFLQLLSFGLIFFRYQLAQNAYIALGRPEYVMLINLLKVTSLISIAAILFYLFGVWGGVLGVAIHTLPAAILIIVFNQRYKLNNLRLELLMAPAWVFGLLAGIIAGNLASLAKHWITS
jgi:O-antigen/teichoic acid export membrane protein